MRREGKSIGQQASRIIFLFAFFPSVFLLFFVWRAGNYVAASEKRAVQSFPNGWFDTVREAGTREHKTIAELRHVSSLHSLAYFLLQIISVQNALLESFVELASFSSRSS